MGTTWYRHNMWPAAYWKLWSDLIIHRIHRSVLEHIKRSSTTDQRPQSPASGTRVSVLRIEGWHTDAVRIKNGPDILRRMTI